MSQVIVEVALAGKTGAIAPRAAQFLGRLDRLPGLVGNHADEVVLDDNWTKPGTSCTDFSSTSVRFAPTAGGRTTLPC